VNTIRQYLFLETGDFAASIAGVTENHGNYARFQCFLQYLYQFESNTFQLRNDGLPSLKPQSFSSILHNHFSWRKHLIVLHWEMDAVLSWND
jgi:hypothetical protein